MATKQPATKKVDLAVAHLDKLRKSVGKRVKYDARTHSGTGLISEVYDGKRGAWVKVASKEKGEPVVVRPTQVKLY